MMRAAFRSIVDDLRTPVHRQFIHDHAEIQEEIPFHLESRVQEYQSQGLSPRESTDTALEQFGDVRGVIQQCCQETGSRQILLHRSHFPRCQYFGQSPG